MGYVVVNVTLGQVFHRIFQFFPCPLHSPCIADCVLRGLFTQVLNETLTNTPPIHIILVGVVLLIYAAPWFNFYPHWLAL